MSKTLYSMATQELEKALGANGISISGFSDMAVMVLNEDIQVSGGVTLPPGKYVRADVTVWVGPL